MRLLIVEDEVRLASALQRGLTAEGFTVDVAHTGPDGLHAASEMSYDAVLLDIMLPGLSGYRIIQQLRAAENWVPILMLTAKDGEYDEADALDLGADDYLTKPFSFLILVARLRALIRRGAPERPVVMAAGDLLLDPVKRRVERAGQEITLTRREYGLLAFLMRHRGETVSKTEILENVWDPAFDGDPNVVEVYIRYLRLKLDAPFDRHAIETVRGMGYRIDPAGG